MMKDTFALLLVAHLLSDFVFQTDWIASRKKQLWGLLLHVAIVAVATGVLIGHWSSPLLWIVVATHFLIDWMKTLLPVRLWSLLADQALHLAVLMAGAMIYPDAAQTGYWFAMLTPSQQILAMKIVVVIGGIVLSLNTGGIVVAQFVKPLLTDIELSRMEGIPNGGKVIGLLERSLVMLLMWINQPAGIGFLVTAKSILRFGDIKESHQRKQTEYVIIGTFLSFGWAILSFTLLQSALQLW